MKHTVSSIYEDDTYKKTYAHIYEHARKRTNVPVQDVPYFLWCVEVNLHERAASTSVRYAIAFLISFFFNLWLVFGR